MSAFHTTRASHTSSKHRRRGSTASGTSAVSFNHMRNGFASKLKKLFCFNDAADINFKIDNKRAQTAVTLCSIMRHCHCRKAGSPHHRYSLIYDLLELKGRLPLSGDARVNALILGRFPHPNNIIMSEAMCLTGGPCHILSYIV